MALDWESIAPFGAEIRGDFSVPLSDDDAAEMVDLFAREHLLVLRGGKMDMDDQRRLTKHFGPLLEGDVEVISNDPQVGLFGTQPLAFHSDLSFLPEPVLVAILYGLDLTPDVTSTYFASGTLGYKKLSPELQRQVADLEVLNVFPNDQRRRNRLTELRPTDPRTAHPLVQRDKRTGEPFLYLCEMQADHIVGLPAEESEALLQQLFSLMLAEDCIYRHIWQLDDCVVWDNLSVQHGRPDVADVGLRTLRRTSAARLGFLEQAPQFGYDAETGIVQAVN